MRYLEEEWEMRLATQTLPLLSHMVLLPGSITQIYIYIYIYIGPPRTSLPLTGLPLIRHTDALYWIALHFSPSCPSTRGAMRSSGRHFVHNTCELYMRYVETRNILRIQLELYN